MLILRNSLIPFGHFTAINICGVLFVKRGVRVTPELINHEKIHTAQLLELLIIPFYILYFVEWLWLFVSCGKIYESYRAVSFEREAYDNERDLTYLSRRHRFGQWRVR